MDGFTWLAVFATAMLSGVFGMAGGMLLLLLLTARMPLAEAMVLHGSAQLVANGVRAALLARHVKLEVVARYCAAAAVAAGACAALGVVVDTSAALILTGLCGVAEPLLARSRLPTVDRPSGVLLCGALVASLQVTAGAPGPVLDAFFARSALTRHENVATKAVLQSAGHIIKIAFFIALGNGATAFGSPAALVPLVLASVLGTWLGRSILDRVGEALFRRGTRFLVRGLGALSLARGVFVLAA